MTATELIWQVYRLTKFASNFFLVEKEVNSGVVERACFFSRKS